MHSILVIEDSQETQVLIQQALRGFDLTIADTIQKAKIHFSEQNFDLVILDVNLPDGNGIHFLSELMQTKNGVRTSVFVLSAEGELSSKVTAFSIGAEDYITKPFHPVELRARIEGKLKRKQLQESNSDFIDFHDLKVIVSKQRVSLMSSSGEQNIDLTGIEFKLLCTLIKSPDLVFSRTQLIEEVWGAGTHITDRTVDTHISNLRKKIAQSKSRIETVFGGGYRLSKSA